MIKETMAYLSQYDPEVGATIENEYHREQRNIELIASENIVSPAVMLAMGTCLTNKYAEGYPGKRYYGGCYCVDETEETASAPASSSAPNTPMFSLTPALPPIWPRSRLCSSPATLSWA